MLEPSSLPVPPPPFEATGRPAAPLPEPPCVRPGSAYDAKRMRERILGLLAGLERAGDTLTTLLQTAREKAVYRMLTGPDGAYFPDWSSFCTCPAPWGLGLDAAALDALVREQRDPRRKARLVLEGPPLLRTRAGPRTGRPGVRGLEYTLARLRRDRVDLLERVAAGALSIQAAAELAGHKPPITGVLVEPQSIARLVVSRLDDDGQREVIRLVQHPREIPDPGHGRNPYWEGYKARTRSPEELSRSRARAQAAKTAHRKAYQAAYREQRKAARAARRAGAAA